MLPSSWASLAWWRRMPCTFQHPPGAEARSFIASRNTPEPWLPPHGLRHGLKVWMDEDQIPDVLKSERLGHDEPGMRGVYGHVSPAMREELKAALQARWEDSLHQRAALSLASGVQLLNRLLAGIRPIGNAVHHRLAPKAGNRARRNGPRMLQGYLVCSVN